ncbi:MAG TPA: S8 family serine peptidase [Thermoanaerobaculia bacterium]|nr:S8 family serine peptidase [Thermoanaerobaculia bacterium]
MPRSKKVRNIFFLLLAAICPCLMAQGSRNLEERAATVISLNSSVIDTSLPEPLLPKALRARPAEPGEGEIVLVKFPRPVTARQVQALRAASLRVYTYLPYYAYLVKLPAGAATKSLLTSLGASWSGPFHPAYKISRDIAAVEPGETGAAVKAQDYRPVMIHILPDADLSATVQAMRDLGAQAIVGVGRGPSFSRVRLLLTPAEIAALREPLAALSDVFWIELESRKTLLNDTTIWVGQSGLSGGQTTPIFSQGIFGEGQTVAIIDTGIDPDMCFFRDTALGLPPTNVCNGGTMVSTAQRKVLAVDFLATSECNGGIAGNEWDTHGHGTHVAGTVAGDNFANLLTHDTADGMAPGAKLVIQDAGFLTDNCADLPGLGCPVVDLKPLFQQAYDQGARLHTNSWGDNENGAVQNNYTVGSQDVDQFLWDHKDDLIFFAAGNAGPGAGTVGSPSTNKNGVSVGATLRGTSAESMASFSSCGPTIDGRVKPDITIPGSSIVSAGNDGNITSNNCGTATMSGTSMASPGATGLTALIRQYYTDGWYPTGSEVSTDGFTPSAALLKATLVNSAVSMANTTAIPANCQGWGRILLENALYFTGQPRKLWARDNDTPFATGSTNEDRTYNFSVSSSAEPLKVTLAWTDFPSTPAASVNLNNDLDLRVTGPGGTLWLGNVFSGGVSATGGAADRRNNLEQVLLAAPATGTYTVTVRSFNVPDGPQPFAVVVTGALGSTCTLNSQCDDGLFCNGAETCNAGLCQAGSDPCSPLSCNESTDTCFANPTTVTFTSVAAQDGWVLESTETSNLGGSIDANAGTTSALRVGDDNKDKQYKAVVSFDTSGVPDGATIVSATLRLRRGTVSGANPFTTHGTCWADVQTGGFSGSTTLQTGDFQATATVAQAASLTNAAANGDWSEGSLNAAGLAAISKTGTTQLRVYFNLDDNDDTGNDFIGYYSGDNNTAANRPQLVVTYQ